MGNALTKFMGESKSFLAKQDIQIKSIRANKRARLKKIQFVKEYFPSINAACKINGYQIIDILLYPNYIVGFKFEDLLGGPSRTSDLFRSIHKYNKEDRKLKRIEIETDINIIYVYRTF